VTQLPLPVLRPAEERDVDALVGLARRSWLSAFGETAPPALIAHWRAADRESAWYRRYWPDMIVAEVAGAVAGLTQPKLDEVNGLWVDPAWQGAGVGSLLLQAAELAIASAGFDRAWLTCSGFNRRAAGFYRARGYRVVRREDQPHPSGVPEEVLTYAKGLATRERGGASQVHHAGMRASEGDLE
jgi:ribosomal-protein-alanine N-acetyltransferase